MCLLSMPPWHRVVFVLHQLKDPSFRLCLFKSYKWMQMDSSFFDVMDHHVKSTQNSNIATLRRSSEM